MGGRRRAQLKPQFTGFTRFSKRNDDLFKRENVDTSGIIWYYKKSKRENTLVRVLPGAHNNGGGLPCFIKLKEAKFNKK